MVIASLEEALEDAVVNHPNESSLKIVIYLIS